MCVLMSKAVFTMESVYVVVCCIRLCKIFLKYFGLIFFPFLSFLSPSDHFPISV